MTIRKHYMTLALLAGFGLALGACGGGGSAPVPDYTLSDAQMGATVEAGTHRISDDLADAFDGVDPADAAMYLGVDHDTGTIISVAGLDFACTAGPCSLAINADGTITTTGTIEVVMMGGEFPTAMRPDPTPPEPPEPPEPTPHACDDGPSQACVDARQAELDAIEADDSATVGELNAARTALETAQTELSDHNTATMEENTVDGLITTAMTAVDGIDEDSTPAELKAAEAAIKAAQDSLDGMENLSADTEMALQGRIDGLTQSLAPNKAAVNMAAATAAAGTKEKAIAAEAAQTTDAGLGGTARTDSEYAGGSDANTDGDTSNDVYRLAISRARDEAAKIVITDPNAAGDDDPKFAMNDMGMLVRTMEANADGDVMTEIVLVATDIEGPKATAFAMVAGQALDVDSSTGVEATGDEVDNALAITEDTTLTGAPNANLMFARSTMDGTLNYTQDNPVAGEPATVGVDEGLHDGTYNGAEGTYRCVGTDACTVTFNAKGQVIGNSANWVFIPDKGATSDVDDADYLHYGFWLKRTTDSDGNVEYNEVETIAGSSVAATGAIAAGVAGSATYEGGAAGVYVNDVLNPDGTPARSTSGHFTADASLTATFGQVQVSDTVTDGTIAANMLNSITGTIDEFVLSGGESNTWSVALSGDIDATDGTFSGMAKGGVGDGSLSGTFHGTATASTATATLEENTSVYPHSAVGEFNAGFTNGSVAGAFGVREKK